MSLPALVGIDEIDAARAVLAGIVRHTPMEGSRPLSELVGGPVMFKCENLQRTGSFKIRGAYLRMSRLSADQRRLGVVAASAGNHAQGVALAASLMGIPATVFMPDTASLPKVQATRAYGATVLASGRSVDEALVAAQEFAEDSGATLIHPFDHRDIIAGQGTVGLEIVEQCPEVRSVVVSVGGGGLISGIAAAVRALRPQARVVGAQAAGAASYPPSLAAGHPVALPRMSTMADGIAVARPGDIPFAHVTALVEEIVSVSEEDLSRALLMCLERAKLVVEPAGAAAAAAVLADPRRFPPPVVVLLSGGNVDPVLLLRVIRHGLVSAGRYQSFRLLIPDRPGALASLLAVLASTGANLLDVAHQRIGSGLHIDEVEVAVQLETRGSEHGDEVLAALSRAGYRFAVP